MFKKKRRIKLKKEPNVLLKILRENFFKILLFTVTCLMVISIIWEFTKKPEIFDVQKHNEEYIEENREKLKKIYSNQNPKHNDVRIWVLNFTTGNYHKRYKLASRVTDCLQKGYEKDGDFIQANYDITNHETLWEDDKKCPFCVKEMIKPELRIYRGQTMIIYHNTKPDFDDNLSEFLSFTGFDKKIVYQNNKKHLLDERDITIILGNDWEDSNLQYCTENKNNTTTN